ncbi:MAG: ExeM/NucH family extracellular endonuclease [Anaerolineae bacterium]|nr:ExeM/NucH family extracellular endonuclease [Anaerolineae bacterium]
MTSNVRRVLVYGRLMLASVFILLLTALLSGTLPIRAAGSVTLATLGAPYVQDFDTLAISGTSSSVPDGWYFVESGTNANTTYTAGTGSSNTGDTYSFGASGSSERAFGGLLSGSLVPTIGASFTNNTGATINEIAISYTGEQWRLGATGRVDRLDFQLSTNADSLATGTWVDHNELDFNGPISAGTVGALDGNSPANRIPISYTITGLDIPEGATFWIRWTDFNASGADDGLAVDDFSLVPGGEVVISEPVINEFSASTVGTDVEYVEIFGDPNTDYSAYTILEIEGDSGAAAGTVDEVISLGTTDANGLYLVNLPANALENGSITLLLVKNFTGALNDDLDTNNDGVFDITPWDVIVDAVSVNDGGATDPAYGVPVLGVSYDGLPFAPGGASRIPDGFDTDSASDWVRNDFDLAGIPGFEGTPVVGEAYNTPGAANALVVVDMGSVVISQIYGGGGNSGATYTHDFIELYNATANSVDISGWSVQYASATGATWQVTALSGVMAPGSYYLIQQAVGAGGTTPLPTPDAIGTIAMSATAGKVALVNTTPPLSGTCPTGDAIIDFVGFGSTANCYEGSGPTPAPSNTTAAIRLGDGAVDTDNNSADFVTGAPNPRNSFVIDDAPFVVNTVPVNGALDFPVNGDLIVTFSEPVNVAGAWFDLACSVSGSVATAVTGGPTTFTLNPNADLVAEETCTLTIFAAGVTDQDTNDPPDNMESDFSISFSVLNVCELAYTPIYAIQGSGLTAAITGVVTTQGVVVGDYEGPSPTLRGFYIQDMTGDGDPATSDGIFVFNFDNNHVNLGDVVRVTGTAAEFQDQTQISGVTAIAQCGTGSVDPVDVTMPFPSADYLERYEGMLVRFPQTLYVTEHFQLGRFGQVVMSSGGRLAQPTNVVAPGAPALALQAANNLNRLIVDDALQNQNPDPILFGRSGNPLAAANTLRGGDTATGMVGILTYTWSGNAASGNAYRLRPINALNGGVPAFAAANPRPDTPVDVGGDIKVAGFNLLNYFNTFSGCTNGVGGAPTDCRGAENLTEFNRQWPKTVAAIIGLDADVLGVIEMENDGYGPTSAIQDLVDRLNAASAPGTYAFIDVDAATGQVNALGTDAIKVGFIYQPANVTPVGDTAVLNTVEFVNGGDGAARNRPSLAQAFAQNSNGAVFIVNVNHLKSKGSACDIPDAGDGQGECNIVRTNAANTLMDWLATDPTGTGDPDIIIVGDMNAYAKEDPITAVLNTGFINLAESLLGPNAYSYAFDGQWGYLDHALTSASLFAQVTGVTEWHINADEPGVLDYNTNFKSAGQLVSLYAPDQFRVSDHDPVLVGLALNAAPTVDAGGPYMVVEGSSVLVTAVGSDPDNDVLTYAWDLDNDGVFETAGQNATFSAAALTAPGVYTIVARATDGGGLSATDEATVYVVYNFAGFFPPVQNLPAFNVVNAGSAIPIKFSLNGNKGLSIIMPGYPISQAIACDSGSPQNDVQETVSTGNSSLQYDPDTDTYTYVWKTQRSWQNTCRQFKLVLNDGTVHLANFRFK